MNLNKLLFSKEFALRICENANSLSRAGVKTVINRHDNLFVAAIFKRLEKTMTYYDNPCFIA